MRSRRDPPGYGEAMTAGDEPIDAYDVETSIEVRLISLPTRDRLGAAHDRDPATNRELVIVRLTDADGNEGWGECSALNEATYTREWARGAFAALTTDEPVDASEAPMAAAAIEMAHLDLWLRGRDESLATWLGVATTRVPAGAVVGLGDTDATLAAVERLVGDGYGRIKLKATPESFAIVQAVRDRFDEIELQIDGNGSFGAEHVDALAALAYDAELDAIEQPFDPADLDAAIDLVEATPVPVLADESIETADDADELADRGALTGVVIKPPKLGGIAAALDLLDWAAEQGLAAAAGGMLECGLGRHALAAVAGVDGFSVTGDVSPARRWLAVDPWPDLEMDGGWITVPTGPGVAPPPDLGVLDEHTVDTWRDG